MLKIGDFSMLSRININMLRHYDEIELLTPAHIDELEMLIQPVSLPELSFFVVLYELLY